MRYLFFLLLSITAFPSFAQKNVKANTFKEALKKAAKEDKLIFIQFESATCGQCNDVANAGINQQGVKESLQNDFIFLKITTDHPDRPQVGTTYNIANSFGVLFLNAKGTLLHIWARSTTMGNEYQKQMALALSKVSAGDNGDALAQAYEQGNRNTDFLESYLQHLQVLNLPTDSILDEYVTLLPADSLSSSRTLLFIAKMAPALASKADKALRQNQPHFGKTWATLELQTRININNNIINKSMRKAIEAKDKAMALRVAAFTRAINSNPNAGEKNYQRTMLRFYEATGDTATYFTHAAQFYTSHFMNISIDSVKRVDSINHDKLMAQVPFKDTIENGQPVKYKQVVFAPSTQRYTGELNDAAWKIFTMTDNPYLLQLATQWIEKGLAFYETPEALNTYARLLYKQGNGAKAVEQLSRAIAVRKELGFPVKDQEAALQKMKKGMAVD